MRAIERFASTHKVPVVRFKKDEVKEQTARRYMHKAEREGRFGVVMISVCQERASAWRGYRSGGSDSHPHFCYRRMSVFPNYYYFYVRDPEWGPTFIKTIAYAPWPVWIYLNGHEWAKRQATKRGIGFQHWTTAFDPSMTRSRWPGSAARCQSGRSKGSGIAGKRSCPHRHCR